MSKVAIAKINELSHAQWLKLRRRGIGGSDAAAVCGLNRWRGPLDVYLDKTNTDYDEQDNESMYWGRVMEPVLRAEFAKRTGLKVDEVPIMFSCQEYPFMLANIDGIVHEADGSTSLLEIKTANGFAAKDWDNGLPQEYYIQIQHYLFVCDLKKAYIAVLIGGNDFRYEAI
ncbi:MAG: YqaJ viral recombinase family protein, partial [Selenomonas sp.]|nr:YqaJ viral recombinase family protein [Selenomonas sp.]